MNRLIRTFDPAARFAARNAVARALVPTAKRAVSTATRAHIGFVATAPAFYGFYVCGTAAAILFRPILFPSRSDTAQSLALAVFAIAFIARPTGAVIFSHVRDHMDRQPALVASLPITAAGTTLIGVLQGYQDFGSWVPITLCVLRFAEEVGYGCEYAGDMLAKHAPVRPRVRFPIFPQLGATVGFLAANAMFMVLADRLKNDPISNGGWRLPFLVSVVFVIVGLCLRSKQADTPIPQRAPDRDKRARLPHGELLRNHGGRTILAVLVVTACYALFYLGAAVSLSYGAAAFRIRRIGFPELELAAIVVAGLIVAPMGASLPEVVLTPIRHAAASITCNLGLMLGALVAPCIVQNLADRGGLPWSSPVLE